MQRNNWIVWRAAWAAVLLISAQVAHAAAGSAASLPAIQWHTFNLSPLYITDGPQRGKGLLDLTLRQQFIPALTGYQHEILNVPVLRLEQALRTIPNACVVGLFRNPERETFMHFSVPLLQQLPPGVFIARQQLPRLEPFRDARGMFSLRAALASGDLRIGVALGRSYGANFDALLAEPTVQKQVSRVSSDNPTLNLMRMLSLGRIELMAALPYEPTALRRLDGATVPDMVFVSVSELPQRINGHVACAKSPQGAAVIAKIDGLLAQPALMKAVRIRYESWLGPQDGASPEKTRNTINK